jgi:carbamate kinase
VSLVVVALGGNALQQRGEPLTLETMERNVVAASPVLASLARDHDLVLTHGNGPQVGMLALRSEAYQPDDPTPLDVLGAESVGLIGYLLVRGLRTALPNRGVVSLLTQVEVDPDDPAFEEPTKPIGPVYDEGRARRLAAERGWQIRPDGDGWRRVVASPVPRGIVELEGIRVLIDHGVIPICAGGGGVPVCVEKGGRVRGVEAVVDKDRTAALLARQLQADLLVLLTDVDGVYRDWGGAAARLVERITPEAALELDLPAGSMGPKVEACASFVAGPGPGRRAAIGSLGDAVAVLEGRAGTQICREAGPS